MQKVSPSAPVNADRKVLESCWAHSAETVLPRTFTDQEIMVAREAFDGGARALYELLTRMQALAGRRGEPQLDLARAGRLLGLEQDDPLN